MATNSREGTERKSPFPAELMGRVYSPRNGGDPRKILFEYIQQQEHASLEGFWNTGAAIYLLVVDFLPHCRRKESDAFIKTHLGADLFRIARDAERVFRHYRPVPEQYFRHGIEPAKKYARRGSTPRSREELFRKDNGASLPPKGVRGDLAGHPAQNSRPAHHNRMRKETMIKPSNTGAPRQPKRVAGGMR